MEIIINGQQAYLKKNTSFEYISENPLFTGSENYTLTITFPLKDCPENIRIFGHLHRQDVQKNKVVFDCDIRDRDFFKSGSIVITQISETEVKTQFLEGRSEQNFDDTFDDIYLNELSLGYPSAEQRTMANNPVSTVWQSTYPDRMWIPLPWVNNTSGNMAPMPMGCHSSRTFCIYCIRYAKRQGTLAISLHWRTASISIC